MAQPRHLHPLQYSDMSALQKFFWTSWLFEQSCWNLLEMEKLVGRCWFWRVDSGLNPEAKLQSTNESAGTKQSRAMYPVASNEYTLSTKGQTADPVFHPVSEQGEHPVVLEGHIRYTEPIKNYCGFTTDGWYQSTKHMLLISWIWYEVLKLWGMAETLCKRECYAPFVS